MAELSPLFYFNVAVGTPAAVIGLIAAVVLLFAALKTHFLPGNVNALLVNMCVGYVLMELDAVRVMIEAWRVVISGYSVWSKVYYCDLVTVSYAYPAVFANLCLLALGAERALSTRKLLKDVTLSDSVSHAVKLVIAATWIIPVMVSVRVVFTPGSEAGTEQDRNMSDSFSVKWCFPGQDSLMNPLTSSVPVIMSMIVQELVGLALFVVLLKLNEREWDKFNLTTFKHNLQLRFELKRNISFAQLVIPAVVLHVFSVMLVSVMYLATTVRVYLYKSFYCYTMSSAIDLSIRNMQQIHAVGLPLILLWRSYNFQSTLDSNKYVNPNSIGPAEGTVNIAASGKSDVNPPRIERGSAPVPLKGTKNKATNVRNETVIVESHHKAKTKPCNEAVVSIKFDEPVHLANTIRVKPRWREVRNFPLDPDANMLALEAIWNASVRNLGITPRKESSTALNVKYTPHISNTYDTAVVELG